MSDEVRLTSNMDTIAQALARTPARLLVGRTGTSYRTATGLKLRADHAVARDAVHSEIDLTRDFGRPLVDAYSLFWAKTRASSMTKHLMRPDRGREFDDESRSLLRSRCLKEADLQVVIGDGLSASAVAKQAPPLLDALAHESKSRAWRFGQTFFVRYCRVGILNDIGELLNPQVVVLLIGERPGLATADSLSAYMAFRPQATDTDAQRNVISNIHDRGVSIADSAKRIMAMAELMRRLGRSGVAVKEKMPALGM